MLGVVVSWISTFTRLSPDAAHACAMAAGSSLGLTAAMPCADPDRRPVAVPTAVPPARFSENAKRISTCPKRSAPCPSAVPAVQEAAAPREVSEKVARASDKSRVRPRRSRRVPEQVPGARTRCRTAWGSLVSGGGEGGRAGGGTRPLESLPPPLRPGGGGRPASRPAGPQDR